MPRLLLSSCAAILVSTGLIGGASPAAVPVLVELFTSEGCSSCPPADRLLAEIDKQQPFPGINVIVLSEHVDYWNHLGWADPFSSALYSTRQREYASHLNGEVYTPEAVVDGAKGLVGSEQNELRDAIVKAAARPRVQLRVTAEKQGGDTTVTVRGAAVKGSLYIALAQDSVESQVLRGENSGRRLAHVAVVYAIRGMAKLDGKSDVERAFSLKVKDGSRVVAFVSDGARVVALGRN